MFPWLISVKVPQKEVLRSRWSQSRDRSYARGLSWAIRARWCHRRGLGGTQGSTWAGGLTSVYSPSVRVAPTSRSDSMEMQRRASDEDRRRNRSVPTSPASHLIFPSACFPCLGSSARAANSSAERGDRKRAEKKVWDKSAVHFTRCCLRLNRKSACFEWPHDGK